MVLVWTDGCYDLVHYGHSNQLRQAKNLGDQLIVGLHSDEDISFHKGPPVFALEERIAMTEANRWVDRVIPNAPYVTKLSILEKYQCDFCVHGDDRTFTASGEDTYAEIRKIGKYLECERTRGVSTTEIVGRMLLCTKEHHFHKSEESERINFLNELIMKFSKDLKSNSWAKENNLKVGYLPGCFDLFHPGSLEALKIARTHVDYLIVGLYTDTISSNLLGRGYPILNSYERCLSLLACRYVDEVLLSVPLEINDHFIKQNNISLVLRDKFDVIFDNLSPPEVNKDSADDNSALLLLKSHQKMKEKQIFLEIERENGLRTNDVVSRIINNRLVYEERNRKKNNLAVLENSV